MRTVVRRPWWPLLPLLVYGAEDPAPSKLSFFGSAKEEAPPSKLSFFGSASAGDARRQEDGQDRGGTQVRARPSNSGNDRKVD